MAIGKGKEESNRAGRVKRSVVSKTVLAPCDDQTWVREGGS